jgi:putative holliday junction resolvase
VGEDKGESGMRSLGLDIGGSRTGVAISDPQGMLATPLTVLDSRDEDALIDAILGLVRQHGAGRIVIGLPRRLSGEMGKQAGKVTAFADRLSLQAKQGDLGSLDIQLWDERLSTQAAERLARDSGSRGQRLRSTAKRGAKHHSFRARAATDAIAAAFILQGYLDSLRDDWRCRDT